MGGRWPRVQKIQRGDPGKTTWRDSQDGARSSHGAAMEPWEKLSMGLVVT